MGQTQAVKLGVVGPEREKQALIDVGQYGRRDSVSRTEGKLAKTDH